MRDLFILHIALGGCLTPEPVAYGVTEDTGGHIAYVLGAASAQVTLPHVARVEILTRRFTHPTISAPIAAECAIASSTVVKGLTIRRLATRSAGYLSKEALRDEVPDFAAAAEAYLSSLARRPDVIHAHFADAAIVGLRLRSRFGIPLIYTPHSLAADKPGAAGDRGARRRLVDERRALSRADAIVVSSRDEGERQVGLYRGAALARVRQIRPGCDLSPGMPDGATRLTSGLAEADRPMILAVARPVAKKNLTALARAYAGSAALQAQANLVILAGQQIGEDWGCPEQRAQVSELHTLLTPLAGRAVMPPSHDRDEVRAIYAKAAQTGGIFVNPAAVEPFGLTTLEAAVAGLPCIVPARGGAAEVVAQIGHGVPVDTRDEAALTAAMLALLQPQAQRTAAAAAREAAPSLRWDSYARATVALIETLRPAASATRTTASRLFVSDIDGTLTGDHAAVRQLTAVLDADPTTIFAVATGRSITEAWRVLDAWKLPRPAVLITSAGSEIYRPLGTGMRLDQAYARRFAAGWQPRRIAALLSCLPGLTPQPAIEQRRWKLGYIGTAAAAQVARDALARVGLAAHVVHSHGTLIDVMPVRAHKAAAVAWLRDVLGIADGDIIVAGDSGNDLTMLTAGWNAIVVGRDPDLDVLSSSGAIYRAKAPHAAGIIEGLTHFADRRRLRAA